MGGRWIDLILLLVAAILRGHGGDNFFSGRSYDIVHAGDFTGLYVHDPSDEGAPMVFVEVDPLATPVKAICSLERKGHPTTVLNTGWGNPNYDSVVAQVLAHLWPEPPNTRKGN